MEAGCRVYVNSLEAALKKVFELFQILKTWKKCRIWTLYEIIFKKIF